MNAEATPTCPNCQRLQAQLDAQQTHLSPASATRTLQATFAQLQAQLAAARKDSSTSSKPPSSDIVKPPKPPPPKGQDKRRIGGQPGHPKHERVLFPPEQVNGGSHDYVLDLCPTCGHGLQPTDDRAAQSSSRSRSMRCRCRSKSIAAHPGWCPHCQKLHYAPLPLTIERGGLVGTAPDHPDRLSQGSLPRLLLHHPQVPPRCRPGDHLAGPTGQDHR